eukprot:gene2407-2773_t
MSYLAEAWDRVTSDTIVNCFRKAGICTASQQQSLNDADDPFQELASEIEELRARNEELIPQELTADDYIDTDDGLLAFQTSQLTDEEIIKYIVGIVKRKVSSKKKDIFEIGKNDLSIGFLERSFMRYLLDSTAGIPSATGFEADKYLYLVKIILFAEVLAFLLHLEEKVLLICTKCIIMQKNSVQEH